MTLYTVDGCHDHTMHTPVRQHPAQALLSMTCPTVVLQSGDATLEAR
jgi:hypothetical protein